MSAPSVSPRKQRGRGPDSIARNTASSLVAQMTSGSLTAILTVFLVRALGPEEYGLFALTIGMASIAIAFADLGITNSTARFVAEHRGREAGLRALIIDALKMKVILTGLVCALLAALASVIAELYKNPELAWPLRAMALATFGQSTYLLLLAVSVALGRTIVNVRLVAAESVLEFSATLALVLAGAGAVGAAFGRAFGYVLGAVIAACVVVRLSGHGPITLWRFPARATVARVGGYARTIFAIDASYTLSTSLSVLLLGAYAGSAASGIFQAPAKLIPLIAYVGLSTANGVAPRLSRGDGQQPNVRAMHNALRGLISFQCLLLAPAVVWAQPITSLLLGDGYSQSADVLTALAPYIFFCGLAPLVTAAVNYLGEARRRVPISLATLGLVAAGGFILIPRHGVVGAAITTDVAFSFYTLAHLVLCRRLLQLRIGALLWSLACALTAAAAMGLVLASVGTDELSIIDWIKGGVGGLAAYASVLIFTREIPTAQIVRAARAARGGLTRVHWPTSARHRPQVDVAPIPEEGRHALEPLESGTAQPVPAEWTAAPPDDLEAADFPAVVASPRDSGPERVLPPTTVDREQPHTTERLVTSVRAIRGALARLLRREARRSEPAPLRPPTVPPNAYSSASSPPVMPPEGAKLPSESGGQPTARPGNVDARSAKRSARRHSVKEGRFTKDGGDVRLPPAAQPPAWLSARKSTNDRDLADVDETHPVGPITNGPPRNPGRPPSTSGAIYQIAWRRDRDVGVFELRPLEWSSEHDAGPTPPPPSPMAEQSPAVPWTWRMPPAPMPEARRAHDDLVDKLLLAGWQRAGLGDMWFAHRFRAPRLLQGRAIRATAVRLLVERDPPVDAIHYREWYRLLQEHGFAVAGKKPLAVFLSQVSRSPVMHKATSAGVYALDRDAAERLRRELSQLEAELHALTSQSPSRPADGEIQTRRRELLLAIGRNERALDEALRGLFPADDGAPDHASPRRGQRP